MDAPRMTVGVHDGIMHADEVAAVACLSIIRQVEFVRTRNLEALAACDLRVDVGNKYNPSTGDFDHHMADFNVCHTLPNGECGPLRSGFGLVWLTYGDEVIQTLAMANGYDLSASQINKVWEAVDNGIVAYIDAVDNGQMEHFGLDIPFRDATISSIVAGFNLTLKAQKRAKSLDEETLIRDDQFGMAVSMVKTILSNIILGKIDVIYYQQRFIDLLEGSFDPDGVVVLEEYLPWAPAYYASPFELQDKLNVVVFPTTSGTWMCQSPQTRINGVKSVKTPAPDHWLGLRDGEAAQATGVADTTFIHKGGHLCVCESREGAIQLARQLVRINRHRGL